MASSLVAVGFVDRASDLAGDSLALRRQHLGLSAQASRVEFARAIADCAVFHHAVARRGESATVGHQLLPAGANIDVGFRVVGEVAAREGAIRALGFVEHFHLRLASALIHQPAAASRPSRSRRVGDQARRLDVGALLGGAVEHRPWLPRPPPAGWPSSPRRP